jgi:hypothetical protein
LLGELKTLTEAEGRNFNDLLISLKAPSYDPGLTPAGNDRLPFAGEAAQIVEDIKTYEALGVRELIFDFRAPTIAETLDRMDHFMTEVAPLVD